MFHTQGGLAVDAQARVLRHVSPAFIEDPVRILRVARFAARFAGTHGPAGYSRRRIRKLNVPASSLNASSACPVSRQYA